MSRLSAQPTTVPESEWQRRFGGLVRTLLYEGYSLFPYRQQALKNRYRWNFGVLAPAPFAEREGSHSKLQAELLLQFGACAELSLCVVFLQQLADGAVVERWLPSSFAVRRLLREPQQCVLADCPLRAELTISAALAPDAAGHCRVRCELENQEPFVCETAPRLAREQALLHSLLAVHLLVGVEDGAFVSLQAPPDALRAAAERCEQRQTWPALLEPSGRTMLCSPLIFGDFPRVAPASPGHSFDNTEIDELLQLSIAALAPAERAELLADADGRTQSLLARADALSLNDFEQLHAQRMVAPIELGERVRLRPRPRGDIWDSVLAGQHAKVVGVDWDLDGACHVSVTLEDDPGADLGAQGLPGHRFFFHTDEIERT